MNKRIERGDSTPVFFLKEAKRLYKRWRQIEHDLLFTGQSALDYICNLLFALSDTLPMLHAFP